MKSFMLLLAVGLVSTEKLDRTYLPPPGSKYSGGLPGDLNVPLEVPKESYTTVAPFIPGHETITPAEAQLTIGTDRSGQRISGQTKDLEAVTPSTKLPFSYYSKVPTTTTSYAFTQTTTYPPSEGFETTISPITGFPIDGPLNELPGIQYPSNQGSIFNQQGQVQPGYLQPGSQIGQISGITPTPGILTSQTLIPGAQTAFDGSSFFQNQLQKLNRYQPTLPSSTVSPVPGIPGYTQTVNQYQQTFPTSTVSPILGTKVQGGSVTPQNLGYTQHLGVQPPQQFRQQFPSTTAAPGYQTGSPSSLPTANAQGSNLNDQPGVTHHNFSQKTPSQSTEFLGYPSGRPSQFDNIDSTKIFGSGPGFNYPEQLGQVQQPSQRPVQIIGQPGHQGILPISGPQTAQNIDQYGNLQTVPFETNIPQQIGIRGEGQQLTGQLTPSTSHSQGVVNQQKPIQLESNQYRGDINIQRPPSSDFTQQQQQGSLGPQFIGQQGFIPSTVGPQVTNIPGQQRFIPSTISPLGTIIPGQQRFVPSTVSPQNTIIPPGQQGYVPSTVSSQNTITPGHQRFVPSTVSPQGIILPGQPGFIPSTVSPQSTIFPGQQGFVPSSVSPQGTIISGRQEFVSSAISPQRTGIPGSTLVQGAQNPQLIGQQVYPTGISHGIGLPESNILQQRPQGIPPLGSQQIGQQNLLPTASQQGFPSIYRPDSTFPGKPDNTQGIIVPGSIVSQTYPGHQSQTIPVRTSSNQQNLQNISPYAPQVSDGRQPSQSFSTPKPGHTQNIYQPGSTALPFIPLGHNQTISPTSSSFPTYSTSSVTSSSTVPRYPSITDQGRIPFLIQSGVPSANIQPRPERPQSESDKNAVIINYDNNLERFPDEFAFSFDTSNGIHADENGTATDGVKADGSFSYIGDDGRFYEVVYSADENGFRPQGDHLPTPPPVPEAIQRVIDQAEKDKEAGISHDGFYDEAKYGHKKYQRPKHRRPQAGDRVVSNGTDIPDEYETDYKGTSFNKKPGLQYTRRPITSVSDDEDEIQDTQEHLKENQYNKQKIPVDKVTVHRPFNKRPEQIGSDEDSYQEIIDDTNRPFVESGRHESQDRFIPRKKVSHKHPASGIKDKPISSKERYNEEYEDGFKENYNLKSKSDHGLDGGIKFPSKEGGLTFTGSDRVSLNKPGQSDRSKTASERQKSAIRPGSITRYENGESQMTVESFDKYGRPLPLDKGPTKKIGTKYSKLDDSINEYNESSYLPREGETPQDNRKLGAHDERFKHTKQKTDRTYSDRRPGMRTQEKEGTLDDVKINEASRQPFMKQKYNQGQDEKTGYEYTPPQDKFDQAKNYFPTRFRETIKRPTTKQSSKEFIDKHTTVRPFITPNVYSDENISDEEGSEERYTSRIPDNTEDSPGINTLKDDYETTDKGPEYDSKETDFDLDIGDDVTSSVGIRPSRPGTAVSSRRPPVSTSKKVKPEYDEYEQGHIQKGALRPEQRDKYPMKFRRPSGGFRTPSNTVISLTTPLPPKEPFRATKRPQSSYQQKPTGSSYETTVSTDEDYFKETTRPGYAVISSRKPSISQSDSNIPSSKPSRPDYQYSLGTTTPGSTVTSETLRPIFRAPSKPVNISTTAPNFNKRPGFGEIPTASTPIDEYVTKNQPLTTYHPAGSSPPVKTGLTESSVTTSVTSIPGQTSVIPGQTSQLPGQFANMREKTGFQNLPTTYRPNYPTDISRPGSVTVDGFGRPISTISTIPDSLTSGKDTGLPTTAVYQNSELRPSESTKGEDFQPFEPRFGQPVKGLVPGQKPAEFGPSSKKSLAYLSPYPSSTDRIIGEDFSGPKQRQRFDPESGYHY